VSYEEILYEIKDGIAKVVLNRPEILNRLTNRAMLELIDALDSAKNSEEVRVIIITAAGDKAFCAGADIGEFKGLIASESREKNDLYGKLIKLFPALGKPCIVAVNGLALAGGCGLAISADITIASENAKLGVPEIKAGLWSMMASAILRRVVGRKKAMELLLTGDMVDAHEAERIGMVNKVVPKDKLQETAWQMASNLVDKSAVIIKYGRDAFYSTEDMELLKAIDYLRDAAALSFVTEDSREGVAAFLEKRKPVWKGK